MAAERRKAGDLEAAAADLLEKHAALEKALLEEQAPRVCVCVCACVRACVRARAYEYL